MYLHSCGLVDLYFISKLETTNRINKKKASEVTKLKKLLTVNESYFRIVKQKKILNELDEINHTYRDLCIRFSYDAMNASMINFLLKY